MTENSNPGRGSLRVDPDVMELIVDEQARLRKLEGKKPSYSEIIRRLWKRYASDHHKAKHLPPPEPAPFAMDKEEEILVDGFLRLLRDRRPIAEVPRTGVLGLIKNWVDKARAARKEENHAS